MYALYATKVGIPLTIVYIMSLFLFTGGIEIASSFWLANSAEDSGIRNSSVNLQYSTSVRLGVYGAFGTAQGNTTSTCPFNHDLISATFLGFTSFLLTLAAYSASTKLHSALVHGLLYSPMSFFDTTPLGRILNRVSKVL